MSNPNQSIAATTDSLRERLRQIIWNFRDDAIDMEDALDEIVAVSKEDLPGG